MHVELTDFAGLQPNGLAGDEIFFPKQPHVTMGFPISSVTFLKPGNSYSGFLVRAAEGKHEAEQVLVGEFLIQRKGKILFLCTVESGGCRVSGIMHAFSYGTPTKSTGIQPEDSFETDHGMTSSVEFCTKTMQCRKDVIRESGLAGFSMAN